MAGKVRIGSPSAIAAELRHDLELDPEGGVLAALVGSAGLRELCVLTLNASPNLARVYLADTDDLRSLNASRESLVIPNRITLLPFSSPDELPRLLSDAPDLNDWIELVCQLEEPVPTNETLRVEWLAYLRYVQSQFSTIDLTGLIPGFTQQWRLPLSRIYMELVSEGAPGLTATTQLLLLAGHPGTGKTTYLRHQAVELANKGIEALQSGSESGATPILLPAAAYANAIATRARPLRDFLSEELERHGLSSGKMLIEQAGSFLCVLIDALDEVPPELLKPVAEAIAEFSSGSKSRVILTVRPAHIATVERPLKAFSQVIIRSPERQQIERFIESFINAHAETTGSTRVSQQAFVELKKRLRQPDLARLSATPLTLTFLALLHVVEGRLPERRVSLYHRLAELLVERWNIARSLAGPRVSLPYGEALRLFAPIAWWLLRQRPSGYVEETELVEKMISLLVERGEQRQVAERVTKDFLDRMRRDMLILLPTGRGGWYFFHPTVAEYLAGVELSRNHKLRRSIIRSKTLFDPRLREIVIFAAGELGVVRADDESLHELISAILEQSVRAGRYDSRYVSLLVSLLMEDVGFLRADEEAVCRRIAQFAFDYVYSYNERMIVDVEVVRAIHFSNKRTQPLWADLLRRFSVGGSMQGLDNLLVGVRSLSEAFFHSMFQRRPVGVSVGLLLQALPAFLEKFGLDPRDLLRRLLKDDDARIQAIGWLGLERCSIAVRSALISEIEPPSGDASKRLTRRFYERLAKESAESKG